MPKKPKAEDLTEEALAKKYLTLHSDWGFPLKVVWCSGLGMRIEDFDKKARARLAKIMQGLGWQRRETTYGQMWFKP